MNSPRFDIYTGPPLLDDGVRGLKDAAARVKATPRLSAEIQPYRLPVAFEAREAWPEGKQASRSSGLVLVVLILGLLAIALMAAGCTSAQVATAEADAAKAASVIHAGLVQVSAGLDAIEANKGSISTVLAEAQPFLAHSKGLGSVATELEAALANGDVEKARVYVELARTLTAPPGPPPHCPECSEWETDLRPRAK